MLKHSTFIGLASVASVSLLLAACADQQSSSSVPADTSGKASVFTDGYAALQNGQNMQARADFEQAYATSPSDPYDQENLAAADQNTGSLHQALPLYRQVIANGGNIYPAYVTRPEVQGMSLAGVAEWNLKLAGIDQYGNAIGPGMQSQAAALAAPNQGNQRTLEVFFAFDRSDLSPEALRTIHEASAAAKQGDLTHIAVTGHTDTVGTDAYNMRLSDRRAMAVQQALEADGISRDEIAVRGVGKAGLLVPTPNGVREPQNRRVEIDESPALTD